MRLDDRQRLQHILDHAVEARALVERKSAVDIRSDRVLELALVRLLEVIGEAAARTSPELRASVADIPWSQIIALRNRLIHGYDSVDLDVLCEILSDDLPPLAERVRHLLLGQE